MGSGKPSRPRVWYTFAPSEKLAPKFAAHLTTLATQQIGALEYATGLCVLPRYGAARPKSPRTSVFGFPVLRGQIKKRPISVISVPRRSRSILGGTTTQFHKIRPFGLQIFSRSGQTRGPFKVAPAHSCRQSWR